MKYMEFGRGPIPGVAPPLLDPVPLGPVPLGPVQLGSVQLGSVWARPCPGLDRGAARGRSERARRCVILFRRPWSPAWLRCKRRPRLKPAGSVATGILFDIG